MNALSRLTVILAILALLAGLGWVFTRELRIESDPRQPALDSAPAATSTESSSLASATAQPSSQAHDAPANGVDAVPNSPREPVTPESRADALDTATLIVTVIDEDSKEPVKGARVRAHALKIWKEGQDLQWPPALQTVDSDGRLTLSVEAGAELHITVVPPEERQGGIATAKIASLTPGETHTAQIALPTPTTLVMWVRLLTEESNVPIETAKVTMDAREKWYGISGVDDERSSTSVAPGPVDERIRYQRDRSGLVCIKSPAWEHHSVSIDEPTRVSEKFMVGPGHETPERARVIAMRKGASLRISVTAAGSTPVSMARVNIESMGRDARDGRASLEGSWFQKIVALDERGLALVNGLPSKQPISVVLTLGDRKRWTETPIVLEPGEQRDLTWVFDAGAILVGRLVDQEGKAIPSRQIWTIPAIQGADQVDWKATMFTQPKRGLELVKGTKVCVFQPFDEGLSISTAETDKDGNFRIEDVPVGTYWVGPSAKELLNPSSRAICPAAVIVEVKRAEEMPLTLQVWRGLFIRGRVENPEGASLDAGGKIRVEQPSRYRSAAIKADGSFKLGPLTPGEFMIRAERILGQVAMSDPVTVKAGDTDIILRLKAISNVEGVVLDSESRLPVSANVTICATKGSGLVSSMLTGANGRFWFSSLPPGEYTLTAADSSGKQGEHRGIEVRAGGSMIYVPITVGTVK